MQIVHLALVELVLDRAHRRDSTLHGELHWHAVTATGLDLAKLQADVDPELVFLFGLLHDTRRESDGRDREHGRRAAAFARLLHAEGLMPLAEDRIDRLELALEQHTDGLVSDDPTVGTCWDADRLHLPRCGYRVEARFLSTEAARAASALETAARRRTDALGWASLVGRL